MNRTSIFALTLISVLLGASIAAAGHPVKVRNGSLVFEKQKFFRKGAQGVEFLSFGEKRASSLEVAGKIPTKVATRVRVRFDGPFVIDWGTSSSSSAAVPVTYLNAEGKVAVSRDKKQQANLMLMRMRVDELPLVKLLNKHAKQAQRFMAGEKKDARIASEVWIVADAKIATDITNCGEVTGEGRAGAVEIGIDAKACKTTTSKVTLPKNITFAYAMSRVTKWQDRKNRRRKRRVINMKKDFKGLR